MSKDQSARQALREWMAFAALPVNQERLAQLDLQEVKDLLDLRGLPGFPALLEHLGLLDRKESKDSLALRALRDLLAQRVRQDRES